MDQPRVMIVSSHSLFAEGVAMRLRQQLETGEILTVDLRQSGALEQVIAAQPATIIVDAGDALFSHPCPLTQLLDALPALQIIRLDVQQEQVQVVTSERRPAAQVRDLVTVINAAQAAHVPAIREAKEEVRKPE